MGIDVLGRTKACDVLTVNVQIHAGLAAELAADPVYAVDAVLQIDDIHAAVDDVVHQRADIAVGVHMHQFPRLTDRLQHPLIEGLYVLAEQGRADHRTCLHPQILGDAHHIHIGLQKVVDLGEVKLTQPLQEVEGVLFPVG